jgi:excinuclease ABC subunit C
MTPETFKEWQKGLPEEPGIYRYYDGEGRLLYVGKAKNIRKRVSSYFTAGRNTRKTAELVRRIERMEFTIVGSEQDALLLENSLIKEFQPRFNIDLKDDKTYPYIVIRNEDFPRVFLTRRMIRDGSEYLGPFTSSGKVRELLGFIRQHIQIRTCKLNLSPKQLAKGNYRPCLEYQLGNCKAPCAGLQSPEDYREGLSRLRSLLKGNLGPVMQHYRSEMKRFADNLDFEAAEQLRKKIEHLKNYSAKSPIMNPRLGDIDVFSMADDDDRVFVNLLMLRNGVIIDTHDLEVRRKLEEEGSEILSKVAMHLRERFRSEAPEVVVPMTIELAESSVKCTVPKAGDRLRLLELSLRNAEYARQEFRRRSALHLGSRDTDKAETLERLQADLRLPETPIHIECFDNSNLQGSHPVSAMVCFRDGLPSKSDYRHFHVKTVTGIDDFATMREVVARRYDRLARNGDALPQLVIIDGGKGQLGAAMDSIRSLGLEGRMTVVGLAKNEELVFFPGDSEPLRLPLDGGSLRLIRRIRDEVHRFGISFHRNIRSRSALENPLEGIPGIGSRTAAELLREFKSTKRISNLTEEQLRERIGPAKARAVYLHFHPQV